MLYINLSEWSHLSQKKQQEISASSTAHFVYLLIQLNLFQVSEPSTPRTKDSCFPVACGFDYLWYNETRFDLELSLTGIFFRGFLTLEKFERGFLTLEKFERGFLTLEKFDLEKFDLEKFELEKFDLEKFELEKFDLEKFELEFPVPGKFEHVPGKFEHVKKPISTGKLRYGNFDMKSYGIFLNISNF